MQWRAAPEPGLSSAGDNRRRMPQEVSMIEGRDIICFSNDWSGDPLSKKHIMQRLASRNRILWVNSIGSRKPTLSGGDCRRIAGKLWDAARGCRQVSNNIYMFP